jgi:uncharacterized protein involved in type VI secretion and phage assembly
MSEINGVVVGLVTDVNDPLGQGRIKVRFPWLTEQHETDWVRIATMMGGKGRGTFFMPEINDEALLAFEHGEIRFPYVIGFLWNGQDEPPANHVRLRRIQSVNGHQISFIDATPSEGSKGALVIKDAHHNTISLSIQKIVIKSTGILQLEAKHITLNGRVVSTNRNPI